MKSMILHLKNSYFIIIFSIAFLWACTKEENRDVEESIPGAKAETDQPAHGLINDFHWSFRSGNLNTSPDGDKYQHRMELVDSIATDTCDLESPKNRVRKIYVTIVNDRPALNTLSRDLSQSGTSLTIFYLENGNSNSLFASNGEISIDTVDLGSKLVTGSLQFKFDEENYVDGRIRLKYCDL